MRKKHLRAAWHMFACAVLLSSMVPVRAQVPDNPSEWSAFVKGRGNPLVIDTFRMQTFSGTSIDNWEYTVGNGTTWDKNLKKLKIPLGGTLSLEPYSLLSTQKVSAVITFSVHSIVAGEELLVELDNKNGKREGTVYPTGKEPALSIRFGSNPYRFDFSASAPASNTKNGYFLIDSVYAKDTIPRYSLFSGNGNWNDTARWSHLPPLRNRSALINGNLEVNTQLACRQLMIGNGSVAIREEGDCRVDTLALCAGNPSAVSDVSLTVAGNLAVNKRLELHYTFPEKGKWYFLSFPFDVSQAGIDPRFQLKDDTFTGQGDYLYVQVYDGNKRAQNNEAQGNWTVLPADQSAGALVFRRGKGYLVALDAAASDQTLTFSAEGSHLPNDFGKTATVPVYTSSSANAGEAHRGWYLCGNPLPSPLALSQILPDQALDGNVYLYDGTGYKAYPFGSNYQLPPFAAFFVKATADTEIKLLSGGAEAPAVRLKSGQALHAAAAEPEAVAVGTSSLTEKKVECSVRGKILSLSGLSSAGMVHVMDISGRCVYRHPVLPGSSNLPLPLPSGFYVINLVTEEHHSQYKCILAQ